MRKFDIDDAESWIDAEAEAEAEARFGDGDGYDGDPPMTGEEIMLMRIDLDTRQFALEQAIEALPTSPAPSATAIVDVARVFYDFLSGDIPAAPEAPPARTPDWSSH